MSDPIVFYCDTLHAGGVQRTIIVLAEALAARGHRVEIVLARADGELVEAVPAEIPVHALDVRGYSRAILPLARYLKDVRPRGLVAATPWGNVTAIAAAGLARRKIRVLTTDVTDPARVYGGGGSLRDTLVRFAAKRLYPRASARVAVSGGVADALATTLGLERSGIDVVYNPIDLSANGPTSPAPHPWLSEDRDAPAIVAVGRLHPVKDYTTLLDAMVHLKELGNPARLVVFGDGIERAMLESRIAECGLKDRVALPGFIAAPRAAMAAADAYVMTSRAEGLGNALIEAMVEGAPVVSTDCPFGPREILEGGRHGRLVPVGDGAALAAALSDTLAEGRKPVDRSALARFDVDRIAGRYLELLGIRSA